MYVVETSYMDQPHDLRVYYTHERLAAYLTEHIQHEHYSGDGDTIHGIYRYDGRGKLTELQLSADPDVGSDVNDYLYWHFSVWEPTENGRQEEAEFTVTIDGRA